MKHVISKFLTSLQTPAHLFAFAVTLCAFTSHSSDAASASVADGDVAGLIAALNGAEAGDVIQLAPSGTYTLTQVNNVTDGPNGLPVITSQITLEGNGSTIQRDGQAPAFRILLLQGVDSETAISNLTLKNGLAGDFDGGGLFNKNSSPVITNCTFAGNQARYGGGIFNTGSAPTIIGSNFEGNIAGTGDGTIEGTGDGGGIYNLSSHAIIDNSIFRNNTSWDGSGGAMGNWSSNPIVTNSRFEGNDSETGGGGMSNANGSSPLVDTCVFINNFSRWDGGGMVNWPDSKTTVNDSIFEGNSSLEFGGGMANSGSSPTVTGSTFRNNTAQESGGGIANLDNSNPSVGSTVLCGNSPDAIYGQWEDSGSNSFSEQCTGSAQITYEGWVRENFENLNREDESISGPLANPAGDRIQNLLKYALGLDPEKTYANALPPPQIQILPGEEEKFLTLSFSHPSGRSDIQYRVELSNDWADWSEPAILVSSENDGTVTTRTYRDTGSIHTSDRKFIRLTVELYPMNEAPTELAQGQ